MIRFLGWGILITVMALFEATAQSRVELVHADVSRGEVRDGVSLKILEGNVHIRQDTIDIFCDQAIYDPQAARLIFEGNVKILRGKESLTARRITYYEETRIAIAEGRVHLQRPDQELFTDYLEYDYDTDQALVRGNVLLHDAQQRVYITAREGEYLPQEDRAYVQRQAHLWQIDTTGTDTLHIYARRLEYHFRPVRKAIARDSVRIMRQALVARCDSAVYLLDEERAVLERRPRARQEENFMSGKRMILEMQNMQLQRIIVQDQARAISVVDSLLGKENRLEGDEITVYLTDGKLSSLAAIRQARSVYYILEDGRDQGVNTATADTIRVFFKSGELDSIAVKGGAQGTFYPANYQGTIEP
ncbi:MAG: hypothetical protein GXO78_09675 [Calditrichaeota bacterium]|nr:hypothetical protein [Calditrichota bacterium]